MTLPDPSSPPWARSRDMSDGPDHALGSAARAASPPPPPPSSRSASPPPPPPSAAKRTTVTSVSLTELAYRQGFMALSMALVVALLVAALIVSGYFNVRMLMIWGLTMWPSVLGTITISVFQYYLWRNHHVIMSLPTTRSSRWLFAGFVILLSFGSTAFSVYSSWEGLIAFGLHWVVSLPIALFVDLAPEPLLVPAVSVFGYVTRDWIALLKRMRASR